MQSLQSVVLLASLKRNRSRLTRGLLSYFTNNIYFVNQPSNQSIFVQHLYIQCNTKCFTDWKQLITQPLPHLKSTHTHLHLRAFTHWSLNEVVSFVCSLLEYSTASHLTKPPWIKVRDDICFQSQYFWLLDRTSQTCVRSFNGVVFESFVVSKVPSGNKNWSKISLLLGISTEYLWSLQLINHCSH